MDTGNAFSLPLEQIVTLVFYTTVLVFAIFTIILRYHWKTYSVDDKVTKTTLTLYYVTTIPLILLLSFLTLII
ncbi:MAG: hypothetical protein R3B53_02310 [Candidatus Paceibacterota bacterium]